MTVATARVISIDPLADPRWDTFVNEFPGSTAYHLGAWARILKDAYGGEPEYLALESSPERIEGALPLMRTWGLLAGTRYRTLPVVPPAGPLARDDEGRRALLDAARERAAARETTWTLHAREDGLDELVPGLTLDRHETSWHVELPSDPDEMRASLKKSSRNLHRSLKKADAAGLTARQGTSDADLRSFYRLYLGVMRRRRSLPRTWRQIARARDLLTPSGRFRLFLVSHDGRVIAAALCHTHRDTVDALYIGTDERFLELRPNHAVYWEAIRWSIEAGFRRFDFGVARKGSSLARFKEQWSAEPLDEYRYTFTQGSAGERAAQLRQVEDTSEESLVMRVWGRAPLRATQAAATLAYRWLV